MFRIIILPIKLLKPIRRQLPNFNISFSFGNTLTIFLAVYVLLDFAHRPLPLRLILRILHSFVTEEHEVSVQYLWACCVIMVLIGAVSLQMILGVLLPDGTLLAGSLPFTAN